MAGVIFCAPHADEPSPGVFKAYDVRGLYAPELAARYRDGMVSEGAHDIDAGRVGAEMSRAAGCATRG